MDSGISRISSSKRKRFQKKMTLKGKQERSIFDSLFIIVLQLGIDKICKELIPVRNFNFNPSSQVDEWYPFSPLLFYYRVGKKNHGP